MSLFWKNLKKSLSYILVAAVSAICAFLIAGYDPPSKLDVLENVIQNRYIGQTDETVLEDAAADAMVGAIGDRWSYYIPAAEYEAFSLNRENNYVGVGITVIRRADKTGFDIQLVEPDGPAQKAGIEPGDIIVAVDGESAAGMEMARLKSLLQGKVGTKVDITVLRDTQEYIFTATRRKIQVRVAEGRMLEGNVGLVAISNFNETCAKQAIGEIEELLEQGAQSLIFDVRNNGGGYLKQLTTLLDYLLPEGVILQSENRSGIENVDKSDAKCLELPMAVLINSRTYSAAEFFAAALEEYDWAVLVGQPTTGKGYYQKTISLPDGSAVNLSVGKYLTPNGVNLQEQGGLTPNVVVEVDAETDALIYSGLLDPEEDPQIQAAIEAMQ